MKLYQNKKARSFVTIMILIAIGALLLRVAIEQIIKITIAYNESNASATLKMISTALENYAKDHLGAFPADLSVLIQEDPPYLDRNYILDSPIRGYNYNCPRLEETGYSCAALPVKCMFTGKISYIVTTGGLLVSETCAQTE